jgi:hypothetical protein
MILRGYRRSSDIWNTVPIQMPCTSFIFFKSSQVTEVHRIFAVGLNVTKYCAWQFTRQQYHLCELYGLCGNKMKLDQKCDPTVVAAANRELCVLSVTVSDCKMADAKHTIHRRTSPSFPKIFSALIVSCN